MPRYYIPQKITGSSVSISDTEQIHHMRDVLRLKAGAEVTIFDIEGNEFLSVINRLDRKQASLEIKIRKPANTKQLKLAIACAIPKKSRIDDIIDKLTQLGVDAIIPLETERGIVKMDENKESRLERWRKIALSAVEQSQRNNLPLIRVMNMKEILAFSGQYDLKLIPTLTGQSKPLNEIFTSATQPASIIVLIGPEGDFTPPEIELAVSTGFVPVFLGDTVLRVETAAIAIAGGTRP